MTRKKGNITLGGRGERLAVEFLRSHGYRIVECNYRVKIGEIDIVAEEGGDLVFLEVKTRSGTKFGLPIEAVGHHKQRKIIRVAQFYLSENDMFERSVRFDVVSVILPTLGKGKIEVFKDAFTA